MAPPTRFAARVTPSRPGALRLLTAVIVGLTTGLAGLTVAGVPSAAAAAEPTPTMEVLLSDTGSLTSKEFINLDWRHGALHVLKSDKGGRIISIAGDGTRTTSPTFELGSYRNGFAAAPNGTFLFPRSYQSSDRSEIVTVSGDGSVAAPAAAGRFPSWHVADLAIADDGASVYFGTSRIADDYNGSIESLTLPIPTDQSSPTRLVNFPRFSTPQDLYLAHGRLYQLESGADPLRVFDASTGAPVQVLGNGSDATCNQSPGQWDGARAAIASFCNPTAVAVDRRGDIFVATSGGQELYKITVQDGVMHWIAGSYVDVSKVTGKAPTSGTDPRQAQLRINDLAIDDSGSLYASSAWNHYGRADEHTEVLKFPDIAPAPTPMPPTGVAATAGDASATVTATAPTDTGRGSLTGFVVTARPQGETDASADVVVRGASSPIELTGLENGTTYDLTVAATNAFGDGPAAGPVQVTPRALRAVLEADVVSGTAPLTVQLDAGASTAPDGATFQFFCGDSHDPLGQASPSTTAECRYDRQSPDGGWGAYVVMRDPATGRNYQHTVSITVDPLPNTVEDSAAFGTPAVEVPVAADGSLTSDSCGAGASGATCVMVDGVEVRLAAGKGTFEPGSKVRIHTGDTALLQEELGSDVIVQGGFAVTWTPRVHLTQPLVVTIPKQQAVTRSATLRSVAVQSFDFGAFLRGLADGVASGVTQVTQTIGAGLASAGNAISSLWNGAAQSLILPNGSATNDLLSCPQLEQDGDVVRCKGTWTLVRDLPTETISSLTAGGYVVSAGAGNVVSAGGGNVISAGGGNVISAGALNLRPATVISAGGGNVVSAGGGNVISAGGGNVVSAGGGNVISAGGGNLSFVLTQDPGFGFVEPTNATPPTVATTIEPQLPASGVYPLGTKVTVRLAATSSATPAIAMRHVSFSATGAGETPYTLVPGDEATLVIDQPGTTMLEYSAQDAQLNRALPETLAVRIAAPVTAAEAPTSVAAERIDNTSARVSWTAPVAPGVPPLTGYVVHIDDLGRHPGGDDASPDRAVRFGSTATMQTVGGLMPGHRYVFRVAAFHSDDLGVTDGALSEASEPVVTATPPAAPVHLGATPGDGQVRLDWSPPPGDGGLPVSGYRVYRATSADGPWQQLTDQVLSTTTFADTSAENGAVYHYAVTAQNAVGESAKSAPVTAAPKPIPAPNPPRPTPPGPGPTMPAPQVITFPAPTGLRYGDADVRLGATSSSGLPVSYVAAGPGVCTIRDGKLRLLGAGSCAVTASQPGDAGHAPAPQVTRSFTVARAPLTVTATDAVRVRGTRRPIVAPAFSGFVRGDNVFSLARAPRCSVRGEATRCRGGHSRDYRIEHRSGELTTKASGHAFRSAPLAYAQRGAPFAASLRVAGPEPVRFVVRGARRLPDGLRVEHDDAWRSVRLVGTPVECGKAVLRIRALVDGRVVATQRLVLRTYSTAASDNSDRTRGTGP